jgi:hypothetical protein
MASESILPKTSIGSLQNRSRRDSSACSDPAVVHNSPCQRTDEVRTAGPSSRFVSSFHFRRLTISTPVDIHDVDYACALVNEAATNCKRGMQWRRNGYQTRSWR